MALSKVKTQWVAGGVVLGVLATMGVQYGMATVEKQANQQKVEQFVMGYKNASDKAAFVRNFDYTGSGASVGFSTSSADGGEDCEQLRANWLGVHELIRTMIKSYPNINKGADEEINRSWKILSDEYDSLKWRYESCLPVSGDDELPSLE